LLAAVAKVTVRRLSRSEPPARIVFYFALFASVASSVPLLWAWQTPSAGAWLWLLGIAVSATLGQLCLTRGLSLAPASRMGTFGYFAVVFGAAYGWLIWDESLTWSLAAGTLLIAAAGLLAGRSASPPRPSKPAPRPANESGRPPAVVNSAG
jgi:drug/metabolite transporter (DMT)-like permease